MKKPNVQLKNVKTFKGMEGIGLNADIYIDGVKCLSVIDSADGGECMYYVENTSQQVKNNIRLMDDYIKTLPPMIFGKSQLKMDRDLFIDQILEQMEKEKDEKKMKKLYATAIVFGKPNGSGYSFFRFKKPLSAITPIILQANVDKVKRDYCKDGVVILNNNLQSLGINI